MALTPEEQKRVRLLRERIERAEREEEGRKALETHAREGGTPVPPRDFSTLRAVGGGVRDGVQGILDTAHDIGGWLNTNVADLGTIDIGSKASNGLVSWRPGVDEQNGAVLPDFEGSEDAGGLEKGVRGITSFLLPFAGAFKAARGLQAFGAAGGLARGVVAGAAADFAQIDPYEGNVVNVMDQFGIAPDVLSGLMSEEDDGRIEARLKATAGGALVGLGMDAIIGGGSKLFRFYKDWKGTREAAEAIVASVREGPVTLSPRPALDDTAETLTTRAGIPDGASTVRPATATYDQQPETFDDVLSFLKEQSTGLKLDDEEFEAFAKNLLEGDPENALMKLGIDPLKLDYDALTDDALLARLQNGLMEVYDDIAKRMGRTGENISEKVLVRGASSMASTPHVLRSLYGATSKLAEKIMASRMIVGAHAHKLTAQAEAALKEIEETGATGEAWEAFLASFHRQAYFLGTLRGAGSEVGRALRSLQFRVKQAPKAAKEELDDARLADAKAQDNEAGARSIEEGADNYAASFATNAERIEALQGIVKLRGDVEELSRTVREGSARNGKRLSQAIKETIGSLFSPMTAAYNVASGLVYLGANSFGRFAAAVARSPMLLTKGPGRLQAQRALYETWAYSEAILGGFREATRNTLKVLEREVLSEVSLVADALGFEKLAQKAITGAGKAETAITGRFERADVVTSKALALTAGERVKLEKAIEEFGGPKFFEYGLKALVRLGAGTINATGAAFRSGTTLFINLPDEFVGTLAKRAGAYSEATRIAAREAADYGLEGATAAEYLKARSMTLFGDGPKGWSDEAFADGAEHSIARAGETEAKMVLFQDQLEGKFNRSFASFMNNAGGGLGSLIIPFIKTPLRILERTARDFTPWGFARERVRNAILHGTPAERDEAIARMSIGMTALSTAFFLAEDRQIVGHDGGFRSSARDAGRPSYSLRIGDDIYEFGRLDPLGTLLGLGADMREYMEQAGDDPDAYNVALEGTMAMFWSITTNMLSKTWLTSVRQITDLAAAAANGGEGFKSALERMATTNSVRLVPAAGIQRTMNAWTDASIKEALGFWDGIERATVGGDLPTKRNFLGREMERQSVERFTGLDWSVGADPYRDPVMAEFERLSMREPSARNKQRGVRLNSSQFSRYLELRGQVVKDPKTGLTMEEALRTVVTNPRYQALPKPAQVDALREVMRGYSKMAADQLTSEDENFALAQLRVEVFELSAQNGLSDEDRDAAVTRVQDLYRNRKK